MRPNILLVIADDQEVSTLAFMPKLQSLWAAQGVTFSRAFASNPLCGPARATLLTGQFSHNHGVWNNTYGQVNYLTTLPVWLQDAGYHTFYAGKWTNGYGVPPSDCHEIPPGWNDWHGMVGLRYNDYAVNENGVVVAYGSPVLQGCTPDQTQPNQYSTDLLSAKLVAFINSRVGNPQSWLAIIGLNAPHADGPTPIPAPQYLGSQESAPFPVDPSYNEADVSDKPAFIQAISPFTSSQQTYHRRYYRRGLEALMSVDDLIGAAQTALDATGQAGNTVCVYLGDNGFSVGAHRWLGKKTAYQPSAGIPLVVRGPGYPIQARSELVANIDIAPTLTVLGEATPTRMVDGTDLGPLLRGETPAWRTALLIESQETVSYSAIRTPGRLYVEYATEQELYLMAAGCAPADPNQMQSQHALFGCATEKAALAAQLAALKNCAGTSCFI